MNKALARLNRDEVMWKAKNGLVLNLLELSLVSGYSYAQWSSWKFRGLPLVQGKISIQNALEWVMSEEMVPETQTAQLYDLCHKMAAVLFDIWIELNFKKNNATLRKEIDQKIDEIRSEYGQLKRRMVAPSKPAGPAPAPDPEPAVIEPAPTSAKSTPSAGTPSPFKKDVESALQKAQAGMALNLRELARALGYSYSVILQWKRDGLPLMDGRVTKNEALAWRKIHLGQATYSLEPRTPAVFQPPPPEPPRWPFRRKFN
jgi:hypothetical protein